MQSRVRKTAMVLIAAIFSSLCLCHQAYSSKEKIAFIVPTLANPFFVDMTDSAREAMKSHPEADLVAQAPPEFTNVDQQVALIENAITLKVGVICLVAADSKAVIPALRKAQDAKIPVLLVDNTVDPVAASKVHLKVAGHVGSDNLLGGSLAGEFICKTLQGRGQVAMLEGVLGSDVANARKLGFTEALAKFPDIHLVASQTANYSREQGLNVFQNILLANPKLDAVFAANDEMALGAVKALQESKSSKKLLIVGFDATADGLAAVKSGQMAATIQQQPKEMGRIAIELALQLMQGKTVPSETMVPVQLISLQTE